MVNIDDFKKLNIVVGTIESAEEIEGSDKLLKFMINIGTDPATDLPAVRQVLGGLTPSYSPADLIGKQVLMLENLEPRKLMGMESQGMILCANDEDGLPAQAGKPVIVQPLKNVSNGAIIK